MTPEELFENFSYLSDWEDRYRYLIEMGDSLPPFPDTDKTDEHKVEGCQSQLWFLVYLSNGLVRRFYSLSSLVSQPLPF